MSSSRSQPLTIIYLQHPFYGKHCWGWPSSHLCATHPGRGCASFPLSFWGRWGIVSQTSPLSHQVRGAGASLTETRGTCRKWIQDAVTCLDTCWGGKGGRCKQTVDYTAKSKNWKRWDGVRAAVFPPGRLPLCPDDWPLYSTREPTCGCALLGTGKQEQARRRGGGWETTLPLPHSMING